MSAAMMTKTRRNLNFMAMLITSLSSSALSWWWNSCYDSSQSILLLWDHWCGTECGYDSIRQQQGQQAHGGEVYTAHGAVTTGVHTRHRDQLMGTGSATGSSGPRCRCPPNRGQRNRGFRAPEVEKVEDWSVTLISSGHQGAGHCHCWVQGTGSAELLSWGRVDWFMPRVVTQSGVGPNPDPDMYWSVPALVRRM